MEIGKLILKYCKLYYTHLEYVLFTIILYIPFLYCRIEEVKWTGPNILVMGQVVISPPYLLENVREQKEGKEANGKTLSYIKKIVSRIIRKVHFLSTWIYCTPLTYEVGKVNFGTILCCYCLVWEHWVTTSLPLQVEKFHKDQQTLSLNNGTGAAEVHTGSQWFWCHAARLTPSQAWPICGEGTGAKKTRRATTLLCVQVIILWKTKCRPLSSHVYMRFCVCVHVFSFS